jgi:SAM-dependent methyltransferase
MSAAPRVCIVCAGREWLRLPDPGPRSMASDLRVLDVPLGKAACLKCGLIARTTPLDGSIFARGYALYAHAPGNGLEAARYRKYAGWIASQLAAAPRSVLDVGCGNGSLLLELGKVWPGATLTGCDPSREAVGYGRAAGLELWAGTLDDGPHEVADLVVSMNVLEHTEDPVAFLSALRRRVGPGGVAAIVCPDAARPGVELLIADHLVSLGPAHLRALLARSGWLVETIAAAPAALGEFQLAVGRPAAAAVDAGVPPPGDRRLARRYLEQWSALDGRLLQRVGAREVVCFGAGEAAGLLRTYAPRTWSRVSACTADVALATAMFGDRPVVPLDQVDPAAVLLLGVRPADQRPLARRLSLRHPYVLAWYDLVRYAAPDENLSSLSDRITD